MKKNYTLLTALFLLITSLNSVAQLMPADKFQEFSERIQTDESYYKGTGIGSTVEEASKMALQQLAENIFVYVISETGVVIENKVKNGEATTTSNTVSKLETASPGVFEGVQTRITKKGNVYTALRYVDKQSVDDQDQQRLADIKQYMRAAIDCEATADVAGALKHAYWAQAMLNCLSSDPRSVYYEEKSVVAMLPGFIQNILSNIKAEVFERVKNDPLKYKVKFTYKGKQASNMRYQYNSGYGNWLEGSTRDGIGSISIIEGYPTNSLTFKWIYRNDEIEGSSIKKVLDCSVAKYENELTVEFPEAIKNFDFEQPKAAQKKDKVSVSKNKKLAVSQVDAQKYTAIVSEVLERIKSSRAVSKNARPQHYATIKSHFTESGFNEFLKLIGYGKITVLDNTLNLRYTHLNGYTYCRSVRMDFSFSHKRSFTENVVFQFDETGKISGVSFALGDKAIATHIDGKGDEVDDNTLITLLENYRTAYALEDLKYLKSIFSPKALIVSGKKIKTYTGTDGRKLAEDKVELQRMTVEQYMKRLERIFDVNEFVNIQFSDYLVKRVDNRYGRKLYSVQIKQDYFSSIYGDTGYLFLYVDITNPNEPIIHIRAWQDKVDPDWGLLNEHHVLE